MQEINSKFISTGKFLKDFAGTTQEASPDTANLVTGSSIFEVDTGRAYFYDAASGKFINPKTGNERGQDD